MNPLLDFSGLPRFADFKPEHVTPAVDQLLQENRALIGRLVADDVAATWRDFIEPLEDANERLARAWGQVGHLNAVMNSPELRETYNANLPRITQYYSELSQHPGLFKKFKALRAGAEFATLAPAQRKSIENELRDFRRGGAELPDEKKTRFMAIRERLSHLSSRFGDNLLDATNAFAHYVSAEKDLAGIPEDVLQTAREAAQAEGRSGWKFTLHAPSYLPVLQYADNRSLRELMYHAYVTRASEFGKKEWDNTPLIAEIVKLRQEMAQLLGFHNYAEYSLELKMAESPIQVIDFLEKLSERAKPYAERDLKEVSAFARAELGLDQLETWDLAYASEKLRIARYAFSDQEVKQYFPETIVLPGMFKLVETLYGLTIAPAEAPTWHPDVRFYALHDRSHALVGRFYIDLYARPSKRGGAWMDEAITRRRKNGDVQTPVAYLNCNFSAPVGGRPALFTHDEVITLFHEFGHGLHHLLTRVDYPGVSGINGVEWDAVELPSQFMENFCWEWDVLAPMTRHVRNGTPASREQGPAERGAGARLRDATAEQAVGASVMPAPCASPGSDPKGNPPPPCAAPRLRDVTARESGSAPSSTGVASVSGVASPKGAPVPPSDGAALPRELFDKMLAAKNFQSGLATMRQIEFSLFDLRLHYDFDPAGTQTALQLLDEVRSRIAVIVPPAYNRFPNNFSHIFGGGYAAGYYSYKWAEVLSADAYSLFEENGVLDPATGKRFWNEILGVGGSRPALESFVAFRGREPKIDALLRHNGMVEF